LIAKDCLSFGFNKNTAITDGCWHSSTGLSPLLMLMTRRTMPTKRSMREFHYPIQKSSPNTNSKYIFAAQNLIARSR